jgi:endoglucanase
MFMGLMPVRSISFAADSGITADVAVSQAGYSADDLKIAYVIADGRLADETFEVYKGEVPVFSGSAADGKMTDEGIVWGKYLYSVDFSDVAEVGETIR